MLCRGFRTLVVAVAVLAVAFPGWAMAQSVTGGDGSAGLVVTDITNGATSLDDVVFYDFISSVPDGHVAVVLSPKPGLGGSLTIPFDGIQTEVVLLWMDAGGTSQQLDSTNELEHPIDVDGPFEEAVLAAAAGSDAHTGIPGVQCFEFWRVRVCYYEWLDGQIRVSVFVQDRSGRWHEVWRKEGQIPPESPAAAGGGSDAADMVHAAWLQVLADPDGVIDREWLWRFITDDESDLVLYGFALP